MWNIFRNEFSERQRQLFIDQFEPSGDRFIYRKSMKGPAIPVTASERRRFVDEYDRRSRRSTWMIIGGLAIVTVGLIAWSIGNDGAFPDAFFYVAIGAVTAISIGYMLRAWGAPARELQNRTPIAGERSRDEMKRRMMARTSYGQIAALAFAGAILPFTLRSRTDVLHGWGRLWLLFGGVIILLAGIAAFRKWRIERSDVTGGRSSP